ncbi:hypothetical protein MMC21_002445 [Puttea exsequens]|nr:hypothetical protein [Puttea exsequens]
MSKRTIFTTVTPLPEGITRETVIETLHNHTEMIDLNPLVIERHPIKAPKEATAEEFHCAWYAITDKINYLPGGLYSGSLTFNACFHDLPDGLQTHIKAPMGLDMKGRWKLGGSLPGEPRQPVELGANIPKTGLWLREDVDMKCNFTMTKFVRAKTVKAHGTLVARLIEKAHIVENDIHNSALSEQISLRNSYPPDYHAGITSPVQSYDQKPMGGGPPMSPSGHYIANATPPVAGGQHYGQPGLSQSYFQQHPYGDEAPPYVAPLNFKRHVSGSSTMSSAPHPSQFAAELPPQGSIEPTELDSFHRPY